LRFLAVVPIAAVCVCAAMGQKPAAISPAQVVQEVRDYRMDNEDRIVRELAEFLSIPNVASDTANIQKNAAHLVEMLEARGIETHLLPIAGRGPVVFGKLISPEATRTVIFYAHYDGQPVDSKAWTDGAPFEPVLRSDAIEAGGKRIQFPENSAKKPAVYKDDWRIYARSASDDKSPIVALLAALDALRAKQIPLKVNLKVIFEGEEEAGSTNLQKTLELHKNLLGGAGAPIRAATGVLREPRGYRAGHHGVRTCAGATQRPLWKLGAESGDGTLAADGLHEGCGRPRVD